MGEALFKLMRPEIEKYVEDYKKEIYTKQAKTLIQHGEDNEKIKLIVEMPDSEIDELRRSMQ